MKGTYYQYTFITCTLDDNFDFNSDILLTILARWPTGRQISRTIDSLKHKKLLHLLHDLTIRNILIDYYL